LESAKLPYVFNLVIQYLRLCDRKRQSADDSEDALPGKGLSKILIKSLANFMSASACQRF
jgi:hypothetical protein